ncbi:MAG TPA: hypothetical protein VFR81_14855 [Longimicrobium sp.]|nr:hypothetical protein [Longimicrobium sp.]
MLTEHRDIDVADGVSLHTAIGGQGPAIVLLHGFPQTHLMWRHVATDLAIFHGHMEDFRLLARPARTTLSDCEAVTYTAAYTVLHADAARGCPARERAIYVRQDRAVYGVRMCDYPDVDPRLEFDYDELARGICFR